jgi:hypothetical protein
MDIEALPIALPDGIDYDDFIIGTYMVSFPKHINIPMLARAVLDAAHTELRRYLLLKEETSTVL